MTEGEHAIRLMMDAGENLNDVEVIEWWPYREGRLFVYEVRNEATIGEDLIGRIDAWQREAMDLDAIGAAIRLRAHVAKACGQDVDNHCCGIIRYQGQWLSIRWSDHNVQVAKGCRIRPSGEGILGHGIVAKEKAS